MNSNFESLKSHILDLSEAKDFDTAKFEWEFVGAHFYEEGDYCPCGQFIKEVCFLRNIQNGNETFVGNICVKRFMGIDFDNNLFAGLRRIRDNELARPNQAVINYGLQKNYIYKSEQGFLANIKHRRNLTFAQEQWLLKINRRIVNGILITQS